MITKITKAYTRKYTDNGQLSAYVKWIDNNGKSGRTEGKPENFHMAALFNRAQKEGVEITHEVW